MLFQLTPSAMPEGYGEALVPLAEAKAHLSIEADEDEFDDLIAILRDAAVQMVERYSNLLLGPQTGLVASFAGFGPGMRVGVAPLASLAVTAVSYVDGEGVTIDLVAPSEGVAGDWRLDMGGGLIPAIGARWPVSSGPVTVTFSAGYPAGTCPKPLLGAVKMFMTHLFENRGVVVATGMSGELPFGVRMICDAYRLPVI